MDAFKKILIVDDEADIVEIISDALSSEDCIVFTATSGNRAKQVLQGNKVDVIVSDIRMKDGDGIELLHYVLDMVEPRPSFYFISGFTDHSVAELNNMGAKALIRKPFRMNELLKLIRSDLSVESSAPSP